MSPEREAALAKLVLAAHAAYDDFEALEGNDGGWSFRRLSTRMDELLDALSDLEDAPP